MKPDAEKNTCVFYVYFLTQLTNIQRAQDEIHLKETKVNLLKDKVTNFIAKAPLSAHEGLKTEQDVLTLNYQRLCSRLDGRYKTLEVI